MSTPTVMSFDEWVEANPDLVEEVLDSVHPAGMRYRELPLEYRDQLVRQAMREKYEAQCKEDQDRLKKWKEAVSQ